MIEVMPFNLLSGLTKNHLKLRGTWLLIYNIISGSILGHHKSPVDHLGVYLLHAKVSADG